MARLRLLLTMAHVIELEQCVSDWSAKDQGLAILEQHLSEVQPQPYVLSRMQRPRKYVYRAGRCSLRLAYRRKSDGSNRNVNRARRGEPTMKCGRTPGRIEFRWLGRQCVYEGALWN
jgi:hypothetical protein